MADIRSACDSQAGCAACGLWRIMRACSRGTGAAIGEQCYTTGDHVVLLSREEDQGITCLTNNHWLVLPTAPCTGVESADPACAGAEGERHWGSAQEEALRLGFAANGSADGQGPTWGILINPAQQRSQHQMHLRVAGLNQGVDAIRELRALAAGAALSTNTRRAAGIGGGGLRCASRACTLLRARACALLRAGPQSALLRPYPDAAAPRPFTHKRSRPRWQLCFSKGTI